MHRKKLTRFTNTHLSSQVQSNYPLERLRNNALMIEALIGSKALAKRLTKVFRALLEQRVDLLHRLGGLQGAMVCKSASKKPISCDGVAWKPSKARRDLS